MRELLEMQAEMRMMVIKHWTSVKHDCIENVGESIVRVNGIYAISANIICHPGSIPDFDSITIEVVLWQKIIHRVRMYRNESASFVAAFNAVKQHMTTVASAAMNFI